MDIAYKDASGQIPGKSIVFAITHDHAMRLEEVFNEMYPQYKGLMARVIDSKIERAADMIDKFKKDDLPRIAISVDMLDTGIDVPEVVNLAFMKPVNSQIKFWQMIGRGTRHQQACKNLKWLPSFRKDNFLIVDYWENFEHFNLMKKGEEDKPVIPAIVSLFQLRLSKLELLLSQPGDDLHNCLTEIRQMIRLIPTHSFTVKREMKNIREVWEDDFWNYMNKEKIEILRMRVAPLLRFAADISLTEIFFLIKMERLALLILNKETKSKAFENLKESIKEELSLLPTNISQVAENKELITDILGGNWFDKVTVSAIDAGKKKLSPLMKYKRDKPSLIFELGLDDIIESRKWVILRKQGQKLMVEEYRKKIEEKIIELANGHPAIQKLKTGKVLTASDLADLEITLETELGSRGLNLDEDNMLKTFGVRAPSLMDFLKHILKLENLPTYEQVVRKAFDAFILEHRYNADQTRFLRTVQSVFLQKRKLDTADLYEAPFSNFGTNAVEKLFSDKDIEELVELTKRLVA